VQINLELSKKAQKIFNNLKLNSLDILEEKRLDYLKQYNKRSKINWYINLPLLLLLCFIDIYFNSLTFRVLIYSFVPLLYLWFSYIPLKNYKKKYISLFNNIFIVEFIKKLFNLNYINEKDYLKEKLKNFKLLGNYNTYFGEDYLHGTIDKNIKLEFEEAGIIGDDIQFKGGVVLLEMPFSFKQHIIIKSKFVYQEHSSNEVHLDKITTNNNIFNEYFDIFSNKKTDEENILTDKLLNTIFETSAKLYDLFNTEFLYIATEYHNKDLIELKDKMEGSALEIEFKDNKVLILLRGQYNILEPANLDESVYCTHRLSVIEKEFNLIQKLAKTIKNKE
jgi:hypothetical protein